MGLQIIYGYSDQRSEQSDKGQLEHFFQKKTFKKHKSKMPTPVDFQDLIAQNLIEDENQKENDLLDFLSCDP